MAIDYSNETYSNISGTTGNDYGVNSLSTQRALWGLHIGEDSDDPCHVEMNGKDPENVSTTGMTYIGLICPHGYTIRLNAQFNGVVNPHYFVRGVAVCLSNSGKVKGIAVVAAKLPAGTTDVEQTVDWVSDQSANCATWHPWVYCPSNKFATGVATYSTYNGDTSPGDLTGIALVCNTRI